MRIPHRLALVGAVLLLSATACAGPTAAYPLAQDPLATYDVPASSGTRTELRTGCMPDDDSPYVSWTAEPTGVTPIELIAEIEAHSRAHGWTRQRDLRSSDDDVRLIKDASAVTQAGGREDEEVNADLSLTDDGRVLVSLMAHLGCP